MFVRQVWISKGEEEMPYYEIWHRFFAPSAMKSVYFWKKNNIRTIHAPKKKENRTDAEVCQRRIRTSQAYIVSAEKFT